MLEGHDVHRFLILARWGLGLLSEMVVGVSGIVVVVSGVVSAVSVGHGPIRWTENRKKNGILEEFRFSPKIGFLEVFWKFH